MRTVFLALIAAGAVALATTLPAADSSTPGPVATTTVAEAQLIERLRQMAKPPATVRELPIRARSEVAMAPAADPMEAPRETLVVVPSRLNLRAEPHRQAAILGRLTQGQTVNVAERGDGWVRIAGENGLDGWASAEFLTSP